MAAWCLKAFLIVSSLVFFIVAIALNAYPSIPGISPFNQTIADISHKYDTGISPADGTFAIWGLIYLWLLAITIYSQTLLCRSSEGIPLYLNPGFIPSVFYASFVVNMIGNPAWIFIFIEERLTESVVLLFIGVVTVLVCLISSCVQLENCGADLTKKGLVGDIWATRIIVQNGVALYTAWVTVATTINSIMALHYVYGVSMEKVCYGALAFLNVVVITWFALETFVYDRQLRYVFAHYISFLAGLAGSYVKNFNSDVPYTYYTLALLILVSILALVKVIIIIVRAITNPIVYHPSQMSDSKVAKYKQLR